MSLAVLANHMASKGRNGDSMLVHMSPEEVRGLHALALTHGEKMTINPETGLPEAFSLKSLLKSVLPAVAGFALGPAGFGIVSSALGAGALVGGATALATGSLQKGIMAGLGAYGGANLGTGLMKLGADQAATQAYGASAAAGEEAAQIAAAQARQAALNTTGLDALKNVGSGMSAAFQSPSQLVTAMGGTKPLLQAGLMAAAPIMADAMTPTATPMPTGGGYQYKPQIRPMAFNQYGQTLEQLPMFSAIGQGTTAGIPGMQQQQQPPGGMNTGGIVALAAGGPPKDAMSPEEFKKMIYAGGANDAEATRRGIEYVMNTPGFRPDTATQYWNQALGTKFTEGDYFRVMKDLGKDPYYYEKQFVTKPGPVTGGTVTPGTSTPVGGGQPIVVSPVKAETIPGYQGKDTIYGGGTIKQYVAPDLGTPGKAYTGTQTIKEIRDEYTKGGGTTEMPTLKDFKPTVTGGSKAAYDYLMGEGPYPTNPVIPGGGPIMKPYAESTGMVSPGFFGRQGAVDESGRFVPTMPPTGGAVNNAGGGGGGGTSIVYGPTGIPYANAGAALAAGVTNFTTTPPSSFANNTNSGTPVTDFLFGTQDADTVPVEDRNISYSNAAVQERIDNVLNDRDRSFYYDYAAPSRSFDDTSPLAKGGIAAIAAAGAAHGGDVHRYNLGGYSDGGRLLRGPGDGVSDSIPATIGGKQPARLADGEFVIPARIVSEIGNGSTEAGARKLYAMMDRVQRARAKTTGKGRVAKDTKADRYLPA